MPIILRSQLHALVDDRSEVDKQLHDLRYAWVMLAVLSVQPPTSPAAARRARYARSSCRQRLTTTHISSHRTM